MKVNSNSHNSIIYNLIGGTVFRYNMAYYMKTSEYNATKELCGCVNIETGSFEWLKDSFLVEYYEAEVTLK